MSSISCAVLIWIMRPLHFARSGRRLRSPADLRRPALSACVPLPGVVVRPCVGAQGPHGAGGDLLDLTDRVDAGEQALVLVDVRQGGGLFPVALEAVPDGLWLVVLALDRL